MVKSLLWISAAINSRPVYCRENAEKNSFISREALSRVDRFSTISRIKLFPVPWRSENFSEIETESGKNRITVEGGRLFDLLQQAAQPIDCCTIPLRIEQPPELTAIRHELFHLLFDLRQAIRL